MYIFIAIYLNSCVYNLYNQKDIYKVEAGRYFNLIYEIPNNFWRLKLCASVSLRKPLGF